MFKKSLIVATILSAVALSTHAASADVTEALSNRIENLGNLLGDTDIRAQRAEFKADSNTHKIEQNKAQIEQNKAQIEQNKTQIAQNQDAVNKRFENMGNLVSDVDIRAQRAEFKADSNTHKIEQNKAQIEQNQTQIKQHYAEMKNNFAAVNSRLDNLDEEMKKGFASQAALTGLFQPYNIGKFNLSVALGGYESEQAMALGTGYRFNENFAMKAGVASDVGGFDHITYNIGANFEW